MHLFVGKYFEYNEDTPTPIDNVQNSSQQISSSQELNTQGDRPFQELSEYRITVLKKTDYCIEKNYKNTYEKRTKNGVRANLRVGVSSLYSKHFSAHKYKSTLKYTRW